MFLCHCQTIIMGDCKACATMFVDNFNPFFSEISLSVGMSKCVCLNIG